MCFQRNLILIASAMAWLTTINCVNAQDAFWYPQPTQPAYPVYESIPYHGSNFAPSYSHCPPINSSYQHYIPQTEVVVPQSFGTIEIIQTPSNFIPHAEIVQPSIEIGTPDIAPPLPNGESNTEEIADEFIESPSDISIEELEAQSRSNDGQRFIEIEGQIEGLRDTMAQSNSEINSKLESLEESMMQSKAENREQLEKIQRQMNKLVDRNTDRNDRQVEKLLASLEKEKRELEERLQIQAAMIEQLQAELKNVMESVRDQGARRGNRNPRADVDRIMDQMSEIIEKEIKNSIRDQRERIIRNLMKEVNRELQEKKKRKKKSDEDDCEDDD